MKNSKFYHLAIAALIGLLAISLQSCKKNNSPDTTPVNNDIPNYVIFGNNDASAYMLGASDLTTGTISIVGNGADITKYEGIRAPGLIQKNGFFYFIDATGGKFSKLKFEKNNLTVVKEIPFATAGYAVGSYQWTDDNTLFIDMYDTYAIVNVSDMTFIKNDKLPIPLDKGPGGGSADAAHITNGKLYVGFTYFDANGNTDDTTRLAVMDYPAMNNVVISKDTRAPYPGGTNGSQPALFKENGYIYYTCTSIFASTSIHSAILRVKVGETAFDKTYYFDLNIGNADPSVGLYYLGNNKAITKIGSGFYVVDVVAKTKTKINVPASALSFRGNVLVDDNGKVRIWCDSDYYVYTYDQSTGSVTKGLKIEGINFIQGLYKLK